MRQLVLLTALILSTLTACTPSHCEEDGVQHRVGDTYTCADGCNFCECGVNGVTSTRLYCAEDTGVDDTADTIAP